MTLLDTFIRSNSVDVAELLRLSEVSERYLAHLREGRSKPAPHTMERIARACSWLVCRKVGISELFDA